MIAAGRDLQVVGVGDVQRLSHGNGLFFGDSFPPLSSAHFNHVLRRSIGFVRQQMGRGTLTLVCSSCYLDPELWKTSTKFVIWKVLCYRLVSVAKIYLPFFLTIYIFPSALSLGSFSTGDCAFLSPEKYSVVPLQVLSSASFFLSCFLL